MFMDWLKNNLMAAAIGGTLAVGGAGTVIYVVVQEPASPFARPGAWPAQFAVTVSATKEKNGYQDVQHTYCDLTISPKDGCWAMTPGGGPTQIVVHEADPTKATIRQPSAANTSKASASSVTWPRAQEGLDLVWRVDIRPLTSDERQKLARGELKVAIPPRR